MTTRRNPFAQWIAPALLGVTAMTALPAARAADVGVSIGFSQPGVYGRVDIGRYPQPVLLAPQPVIIGRPAYRAQPVYLWVPPEHRHNWRRHCSYYGACGAPVYFVEDGWYRQNVIVYRDRDRDWRRGDWHDRHHGRGHGHGHGHGHRD
jgi:hypothetical protein